MKAEKHPATPQKLRLAAYEQKLRAAPLKAKLCSAPDTLHLGLELCTPEEVGLDSKVMEEHRARNRWQGSLGVLAGNAECVIAGQRVAYVDVMGRADVERGTPFRASTLCRCFSMTKPVTAAAMAKLVDERKLSWDDRVDMFIPSFKDMKVVKADSSQKRGVTADSHKHVEPCRTPMTIRHLLTHTSGLTYGPDRMRPTDPLKANGAEDHAYLGLCQDVDSGEIRSLREFCDRLAELPLRFQPGTQWMYSHGVDVAGRIIEVVDGRTLDVFLSEEIFKPLGMHRSAFFVGRGHARDLAALYVMEERRGALAKAKAILADDGCVEEEICRSRRVDGARPEESRWYGAPRIVAGGGMVGSLPAGGLVSCLHDMARFVCMLSNSGKAPSGLQLLQSSTVRGLMRDWLALSSVVGHAFGRRKALKGWPHGPKIGWNPLGHVRKKDKCLYMGGWSTSWAIYPETRLATVSMSQSLVYFDVPGWVARKDELDAAVEFGVANQRRRAALRRHQLKAQSSAAGPRSPGKALRCRRRAPTNATTPRRKRKSASGSAASPAKRRCSEGSR